MTCRPVHLCARSEARKKKSRQTVKTTREIEICFKQKKRDSNHTGERQLCWRWQKKGTNKHTKIVPKALVARNGNGVNIEPSGRGVPVRIGQNWTKRGRE